jgi:hypothetical protein
MQDKISSRRDSVTPRILFRIAFELFNNPIMVFSNPATISSPSIHSDGYSSTTATRFHFDPELRKELL